MDRYDVEIPLNHIHLNGILQIPSNAIGIVLFAHGSGSSRFSKRNQEVASVLNKTNIATFLFDLLTTEEEKIDQFTREHRFDIGLLSSRLIIATDWLLKQPPTKDFAMGYFGASTGAAAALLAASERKDLIKAVVSRGGRPDLAGDNALSQVRAPTLLIVGGNDESVITLNQDAMKRMHCITKLDIIPGATHLFEEPGALDHVSALAKKWFVQYLI